MKPQYSLLFLFVFVLCSSVIYTNRVAGEEPSSETKNTASPQGQDILSQLFPMRNRVYPHHGPQVVIFKSFSDAGDQHLAKTKWDYDHLNSMKNMFSPNELPKNMSVIYIPDPKGNYLSSFWGESSKHLVSFRLDETYVTIIWMRRATAITFEYGENHKAPPKLEALHQELSRLLPVMSHLVLGYNSPRNKDIYQGDIFDESKLYCAEAKKEKVLDERWVKSVRWWRGCGRFGISFASMTPWEYGGGTRYDIRDTYGERL